jgi:hypothetical protein
VVAAAHGQAPVDPSLVKVLSSDLIPALVDQVQSGLLAQATEDDVALIWLKDASKTAAVAAKLQADGASAGVDKVLWGDGLAALLPDARNDPRAPDLVVLPRPGVLYAPKANKIAEHGGTSDDDRKVALLLYGAGVPKGQSLAMAVETRQVAPTVLAALGLDPQKLQAVQKEGTAVLPGLALGSK